MINTSLRELRELRKTNPPVYRGAIDPVAVEKWLRRLCRKMTFLQIPEERQALLATEFLADDIFRWWESMTTSKNRESISWAEFEITFLP